MVLALDARLTAMGRTEVVTIEMVETVQRARDRDYRCMECDQPVRPFRDGGDKHPAHFEHHERNPECSRSHPLTRR